MVEENNKTESDKVKDCLQVLDVLKEVRRPYEPMIEDILTFINVQRRGIEDKGRKGDKRGQLVYDGTALGALNLLSDGLHGYLIAPSMRWFSLTLPNKLMFPRASGMRMWSGRRMDEIPEVKVWLEDYGDVLYAAFMRSNFYDITPEFFKDGGSIGTAAIYLQEDLGSGRTTYSVPHFREYFIAEDVFGQVDTVYRDYKLTLKQLAQKFGYDQMVEADNGFERDWKKNKYIERKILHALYPRADIEQGRIDAKNKPIESLWVLPDKKKILLESGYDDMPAVVWRWRKNVDEIYGRSPAWDAFTDVMTVNQQGKTNLIAGQKMAEPPMVGPEDLRGLVQSDPKGWTWVKGDMKKMMPQALNTGIQLPYALDMQDRQRAIIREHFHVDFFMMLQRAAFEKANLTATQVIEMQGEKAAVLGTRIGRLQSEFLNPIIDKQAKVEERAGRLPEPPQVLFDYGGHSIEVDYQGPLAQAQKRLFKGQGIMEGLVAVGELGRVFPEALDGINPDKTARELLESKGFPGSCLNTDDQIKAIRELRQQQREMQEAMQAITEGAKVLPAAGKAIEPGSPLALVAGGK
jgi:hypothetical protein